MHLGLIDGPFVPHNLISTLESPVPLLKFQMVPRLKILMAFGSKKGTQIHFSFKSPGKRTPSRFPNKAPWRDRPVYKVASWNPSQRDAPPLEPSFIHL